MIGDLKRSLDSLSEELLALRCYTMEGSVNLAELVNNKDELWLVLSSCFEERLRFTGGDALFCKYVLHHLFDNDIYFSSRTIKTTFQEAYKECKASLPLEFLVHYSKVAGKKIMHDIYQGEI